MATSPPPDLELDPLQGPGHTLEEWVTTFHLTLVVLDPYTYESSWLIDTAGRIIRQFQGADCRLAWLVTSNGTEAATFLGPWSEEVLTFPDPERTLVAALGLERLPAIVHLDHSLNVVGAAEGWDPPAWRQVTDNLAKHMSWARPQVPAPGDPPAYTGTPAIPDR